MEENLKIYQEFCEFIRSLDEEGIEAFIAYGKENVQNFGNETAWRETITRIREEKK